MVSAKNVLLFYLLLLLFFYLIALSYVAGFLERGNNLQINVNLFIKII